MQLAVQLAVPHRSLTRGRDLVVLAGTLLVAAATAAAQVAPAVAAVAERSLPVLAADTTGRGESVVPAVPTPASRAPVTLASGPRPAMVGLAPAPADTGRPHAVTYSDAYGTRLTIHRYASYATLPVFAAEYVLGNRLIHAQQHGEPVSGSVKGAHGAVALALGGLFTVNTVTGVWNWWDARHDENGRARRTVHSALMVAADAGFAVAGALAGNASQGGSRANAHRTVALGSMGLTVIGGAMMYLWKD